MSSEYKYMDPLNTADGPRVLAHPAQVSRSRVATLSCSVDSNPPSKVVWYRQGSGSRALYLYTVHHGHCAHVTLESC